MQFMKASILFLYAAFACLAQAPQTQSVVSPEVHPDRRVTFRVAAPKSTEVTFFGDWMPAGTQEKMSKGEDGVWSLTIGPLPPSVYIYTFNVDGLTIADPVNPRVKLRARTSASLVEIPGSPHPVAEPRDVPHGSVTIEWQKSKVLGETRWIWIYTPPGYDKERTRKFPVLYLFHGSNDTAAGWTLVGGANFTLDDLIAGKAAVPMILVMPFGHAVPFGSPRETQAKNTALFEDYFLQDVLPFVESKYRVDATKAKRGIAGLSMGGGQALQIGFGHQDLFSAIGAFSAAVPADFESRFGTSLEDKKVKTIWIGCGKQDSLITRSENLSGLLEKHEITHTFRATEGNHTYTVWRQYLAEFLPLLFR